jgi:radical SAM protein with 4Fe4S-binding SPASM domain
MSRPEYIIWIFTAACNLDCIHCYTYRFRKLKEMSLEEKLKLAKSIGEAGVEYVNLTGGEPLIHPHIPQMLRVLNEYGVETSVVTNATVVREEVLELLYKTDTYVFATIEGPREVHDKIRGRGSYDMAMKGLELIRRRLSGFTLVTTVNKVNYRQVHEVVDIAVSLDADALAVLPVMPSGRALETGVYITSREYLEALEAVLDRAGEYGLKVSAWCTPWAPLLKRDVGFWFCREMSGMDIDPEGNVLLCDIVDHRVASVKGRDVVEVYKEFLEHPLVKAIKSPPSLPQACRRCPISWGCRGGCYARAYALKKDFNAGDPLCPRVSGLEGEREE